MRFHTRLLLLQSKTRGLKKTPTIASALKVIPAQKTNHPALNVSIFFLFKSLYKGSTGKKLDSFVYINTILVASSQLSNGSAISSISS